MNKWISVKDRFPELIERKDILSSENVLAFDGENLFVANRWKMKPNGSYRDETEHFQSTICDCCNNEIGEITHWMKLPEPPK